MSLNHDECIVTPVKSIPLTQGKYAIIDSEYYDLVSGYAWFAFKPQNVWYAANRYPLNTRMHNFITGWPQVDHENGNGLDNRMINLRPTTNSLNQANTGVSPLSMSKLKGVCWRGRLNKWEAHIRVAGKYYSLGCFTNKYDAAIAYDHAAIKNFGSFAKTNAMMNLISHDTCTDCNVGR